LALARPLPVYFLYWTALPGPDGQIEFRPDRNGRDAPLIAALREKDGADAKGPAAKSRLAASPSDNEDFSP
jgi:murein L,D-transpeptidase YcbB/YkuD